MKKRINQKKRHHYIPVAYLSRFSDGNGRIFAYQKDDTSQPLHIRPENIAYERYYYSQPLPEGGQDNNQLENFFSETETQWPDLVRDLSEMRSIEGQRIKTLFNFISLLRVRVPAARDPVELLLAHMIRLKMQKLIDLGKVSPPPTGVTLNDIEITIDPHRSLHAMHSMLQGIARLWECVGLEVVHNKTTEVFATSDNPVMYFDPDVPEEHILPYTVRPPKRRVELLMPISPTVMIRGETGLPIIREGDKLRHTDMTSELDVIRVNRFVARFGYRFVFASHGNLSGLVAEHAALSPTVSFQIMSPRGNDALNLTQMIFAPRPQKPRWKATV